MLISYEMSVLISKTKIRKNRITYYNKDKKNLNIYEQPICYRGCVCLNNFDYKFTQSGQESCLRWRLFAKVGLQKGTNRQSSVRSTNVARGGKQRAKHEWSATARNFNIKSISITYSQSNGEPLNAIGITTYLTKLFHSTTTSYRNTSYLMR